MFSSTSADMVHRNGKIGLWWSEKKRAKLNVNHLRHLLAARGYELVLIDLDHDLSDQGPFDAIVHKISDILVRAGGAEWWRDVNHESAASIALPEPDQLVDLQAVAQLERFKKYTETFPETIILDSVDRIERILDRYQQYRMIYESDLGTDGNVFIPPFAALTSHDINENLAKMKKANVQFPVVCKNILAHGSSKAHQMSLVFNAEDLAGVEIPFLVQTFVNHNARLWKLFVIRDKYFIIERPSIKNFSQDPQRKIVHFDSADISKPDCDSWLTRFDPVDKEMDSFCEREPSPEDMERIVRALGRSTGMNLFGIDIIIENTTGRYAIIDMNVFPGYDGVDNFLELLADLAVDLIAERKASNRQQLADTAKLSSPHDQKYSSSNISQELSHEMRPLTISVDPADSGIDTSDSCDERKHSTGNGHLLSSSSSSSGPQGRQTTRNIRKSPNSLSSSATKRFSTQNSTNSTNVTPAETIYS